MTEAEAIKVMTKLWGKKAAWRIDKKALCGNEREEIKAAIPALVAAEKSASDALEARRLELLKDPEYVRLKEASKKARDEREKAQGRYYRRRITIGCADSLFFTIKGDGDNWAEAIAKATGAA